MTDRLDARFHALHAQGLLRLPNAWDAGSARLARHAGAPAIATSSAAVAWAHGWPDGDRLPAALLLQTVQAIAQAVDVPLTVDVEGGYGDDPVQVAAFVGELAAAGAVGINIEDGAGTPDLLCRKIAAIRAATSAAGVDLFINARTDVFLRGLAPAGERVAEVARREALYRAAGASGLFVPGIADPADIAAAVAAIRLPLNVMARPTVDPAGLEALGVRRYSAGSAIAESVHGLALALMREFVSSGRLDAPGAAPLSYPELNVVMAR